MSRMYGCCFSHLVLLCAVISGLGRAPLVTWSRDQEPDVVQELLQDSSDKAYGKKGAVCGSVALPRDWLMGLWEVALVCREACSRTLGLKTPTLVLT